MMLHRARIDENGGVIMVISNGGFTWMWPANLRSHNQDFRATCVELVNPATDEDMGQAALRVLNLQRTFERETSDDSEFKHARFIRDRCDYMDWIDSLVSLHRYSSKSTFFYQMKWLTVRRIFGDLTMLPSNQKGLDSHCMNDIPIDQTVTIADSASQAAVGAAIHTALSRCTHATVQNERESISFWKGWREEAKKLRGPLRHVSLSWRVSTQS